MGAAGAYRPAALRGRVAWRGAERTAFCSAGRSAPVDGVSGVLEVYTWYSVPLFSYVPDGLLLSVQEGVGRQGLWRATGIDSPVGFYNGPY